MKATVVSPGIGPARGKREGEEREREVRDREGSGREEVNNVCV